MPNLWKFKSKNKLENASVESYQFQEASGFVLNSFASENLDDTAEVEEVIQEEAAAEPEIPSEDQDPLGYAQVMCEKMIQDAKNQAEEIVSQARIRAEEEAESIRKESFEQGFRDGCQKGVEQGTAKVLAECDQKKKELAHLYAAENDAFLKKAEDALNRQLVENLNDMRDLCISVAEKVVCVSLKSSADVVCKMIQTAVDKQKRREWVHVYIAECDAKRLSTLPASLAASLSELSDHVRVIPMADDESGMCIVEFPDTIIDASATTQMQNIREQLTGHSGDRDQD